MASLTNAQMRAHGQLLVRNTSTSNPGLTPAQWTSLLNDALFTYSEVFPDSIELSGQLANQACSIGDTSIVFNVTAHRNVTDLYVFSIGVAWPLPDPVEPFKLYAKRFADNTSTGPPVMWSVIANDVTATDRKLVIDFWPKADLAYSFVIYGTREPTALSGDSDLTPFSAGQSYVIARMAAVHAAVCLGRPETFISRIAAPLPDAIRARMATVAREVPRPAAGKAIA